MRRIGMPKQIKNHEYHVALNRGSDQALVSRGQKEIVWTGTGVIPSVDVKAVAKVHPVDRLAFLGGIA